MLPGTTYTPEDVLRIVRRRAWIIVLCALLGAGAALSYSNRLPDRYRSEALIMFEPQRIPDQFVRSLDGGSTGGVAAGDLLGTLQGEILSRPRLEQVITSMGLYPAMAAAPIQDVVDVMRTDIEISLNTRTSFRLAYIGNDPDTAQQVAERLGSLFIEENLRDREDLATDTNSFLDVQLEEAKRQLIVHEKKLEEYRLRYSKELPSQAPSNLQAMQSVQAQLQALAEATDRALERRLLLERQLGDLELLPQENLDNGTEQRLMQAQLELQQLLTRVTPNHPDVRILQRTIRDLDAQLQAELAAPRAIAAPNVTVPSTRARSVEQQRQQRRRDLNEQISDIDRHLATKEQQEKALREMMASYQAQLDAVPRRESELVELTRDYGTLQMAYQGLLSKRQEARIAADLERRNIGPQFKMLDPPQVPERPFSPDRRQIALGGLGAGLALAGFFIALLEYRDSTFKREEDVERVLNLRVMALVPDMAAPLRLRARRRRLVVAGLGALVLAGAVAALWATNTPLPF
jgi:polysaccharide chain length determinant protein (PEP-CTERM system associated)